MLINNVSPAEVVTTYQSKYIMWMINSQLKRNNINYKKMCPDFYDETFEYLKQIGIEEL